MDDGGGLNRDLDWRLSDQSTGIIKRPIVVRIQACTACHGGKLKVALVSAQSRRAA